MKYFISFAMLLITVSSSATSIEDDFEMLIRRGDEITHMRIRDEDVEKYFSIRNLAVEEFLSENLHKRDLIGDEHLDFLTILSRRSGQETPTPWPGSVPSPATSDGGVRSVDTFAYPSGETTPGSGSQSPAKIHARPASVYDSPRSRTPSRTNSDGFEVLDSAPSDNLGIKSIHSSKTSSREGTRSHSPEEGRKSGVASGSKATGDHAAKTPEASQADGGHIKGEKGGQQPTSGNQGRGNGRGNSRGTGRGRKSRGRGRPNLGRWAF